MNINASIIDQQLGKVQADIRFQAKAELNITDDVRLKSFAFVYLCVKTLLDLEAEATFEALTEGGGDFGVDAIHMTEPSDGEFTITLFQCKYQNNLEGNANFPEKGIDALIKAIRYLFDPSALLGNINNRLKTKVEIARSFISDGVIPNVCAVACNNGLKWNETAQKLVDLSGFGSQVTWQYVNHDSLLAIMQRTKSVDATLRLCGKAIVEDLNFSRVCIGRLPVVEVAALMKAFEGRLLQRNIRQYLGLSGNRVNEGIRDTLESDQANDFYFLNNGLTMVCSDFSYNALQSSDYQVRAQDLQIVNGGQTCMTILKTMEAMQEKGQTFPQEPSVMIRLYKLPKERDIILKITQATNSQNPVELKDLRSNDEVQKRLEENIRMLGYAYRRQRMDTAIKSTDITAGVAAEAVLAVWRKSPHQAKFFTREHFGKLYKTIFSEDLDGAQVVIAVLLYRIAENHRRRPLEGDKNFVLYGSCFIAMQMGKKLMEDLKIDSIKALDHRRFEEAKREIEKKGEQYFQWACESVQDALVRLYGDREISLQQLAATFRRGDLLEPLGDSVPTGVAQGSKGKRKKKP